MNGACQDNLKMSKRNESYLEMIKDIYEISTSLSTKTYIWGGFTIDIFSGGMLREHGDLDAFTENMLDLLDGLMESYAGRGYRVEFWEEFHILKVSKGEVHAGFNRLDLDGDVAMWRHIGNEGTVYFPKSWLDEAPRDFYHVKAYTAGMQFEYAIKTKVQMLNPLWQPREKDVAAVRYLEEKLRISGIYPDDIYKWIWSYNPFWYKKGYDEFFRPTVAYPLLPR